MKTVSLELQNVDVVEFPCWKLYQLDDECDLLVINSLSNPKLDQGSAMLSLNYLGKLKDCIHIALLDPHLANQYDRTQIKDRSWLQEKTDTIPFTFIVNKVRLGNFRVQISVIDFRGNEFTFNEVYNTLGKFLFSQLKSTCTLLFSRLALICPDLQETQFNFGFDSNQTIKLIGCPGHIINSIYSDSFYQRFVEFWTSK